MTSIHLSDTDIQQYSLDEKDCSRDVTEHISRCEFCAERAKNYKMLFSAINDSPKPVLDFDVADMILAALPEHKKSLALSDRYVYFIALAAIGFLGIIALFLQKGLSKVFDDIALMAMYVLIIPIVGILLWQSYDLYEKHRKQMSRITGTLQQ